MDVCIPRLVNYKSDIHQVLPEPEDDPESECLVGRFCPFENLLGLYAVADELGYVFLNTAFKSEKWKQCKHNFLHAFRYLQSFEMNI
jgi:hypothetical protein